MRRLTFRAGNGRSADLGTDSSQEVQRRTQVDSSSGRLAFPFSGDGRIALRDSIVERFGRLVGGPQVILIEGARGSGKTRLLQELYSQFAARFGGRYWPASLDAGAAWGNPDETIFPTAGFGSGPLTALWLGLRCQIAPDGREVNTVAAELGQLEHHAAILLAQGALPPAIAWSARQLALAFGAGPLVAVLEAYREAERHYKTAETARDQLRELGAGPAFRRPPGRLPATDLASRRTATRLLRDVTRSGASLLMVIDDAHRADEETLGLVADILERRSRNPALIVVTSWPHQSGAAATSPFARHREKWLAQRDLAEHIHLGRLPHSTLTEIAREGLPPRLQRAAPDLAARSAGDLKDLRYLIDQCRPPADVDPVAFARRLPKGTASLLDGEIVTVARAPGGEAALRAAALMSKWRARAPWDLLAAAFRHAWPGERPLSGPSILAPLLRAGLIAVDADPWRSGSLVVRFAEAEELDALRRHATALGLTAGQATRHFSAAILGALQHDGPDLLSIRMSEGERRRLLDGLFRRLQNDAPAGPEALKTASRLLAFIADDAFERGAVPKGRAALERASAFGRLGAGDTVLDLRLCLSLLYADEEEGVARGLAMFDHLDRPPELWAAAAIARARSGADEEVPPLADLALSAYGHGLVEYSEADLCVCVFLQRAAPEGIRRHMRGVTRRALRDGRHDLLAALDAVGALSNEERFIISVFETDLVEAAEQDLSIDEVCSWDTFLSLATSVEEALAALEAARIREAADGDAVFFALLRLGDARVMAGERSEAIRVFAEAFEIADRLAAPTRMAKAAARLGRLMAVDRPVQARAIIAAASASVDAEIARGDDADVGHLQLRTAQVSLLEADAATYIFENDFAGALAAIDGALAMDPFRLGMFASRGKLEWWRLICLVATGGPAEEWLASRLRAASGLDEGAIARMLRSIERAPQQHLPKWGIDLLQAVEAVCRDA